MHSNFHHSNFVFNSKDLICNHYYLNFNFFLNIYYFDTGKTNKEFNMRHDWNSLLSDDESLLMTRYSKKFFPDADDLVSKSFPYLT